MRALLLDYGGVFTPPPEQVFRSYADEIGLTPSKVVELVFGPAGDTDHPWHRCERGEISFSRTIFDLKKQIHAMGISLDPIKMFRSAESGLFEPTKLIDLLNMARTRGIAIALVTNNIAEYRSTWVDRLPDGLIDCAVDSSLEGFRKPNPLIYTLAMERLKVRNPEEVISVDDQPANIAASEQLGIRSMLWKGDGPSLRSLASLLGLDHHEDRNRSDE